MKRKKGENDDKTCLVIIIIYLEIYLKKNYSRVMERY